jgi:hypothetical protein
VVPYQESRATLFGARFGMRKKLVLLGLLPAGLSLGFLFYLGCAVGFGICKFCGGADSGIQGRVRSIIIPLHDYEVHLHHWLLSLVAVATSALQGFFIVAPGLFYGVLGGLVLQGIFCYNDWHRMHSSRREYHTSIPELSSARVGYRLDVQPAYAYNMRRVSGSSIALVPAPLTER